MDRSRARAVCASRRHAAPGLVRVHAAFTRDHQVLRRQHPDERAARLAEPIFVLRPSNADSARLNLASFIRAIDTAAATRQRETELDDQLFRLRIQKSMGQVEAAQKLKTLRRDLARVKTVLREKESA